jgi:hypothetical protein
MKRATLIVLLATACTSQAFATAQQAEILVYRGETNDLYSTPLDAYFSTNSPLPEAWRVVHQLRLGGSGCWRCYVGTWSIRDNQLFLDNLSFPHAYDATQEYPFGQDPFAAPRGGGVTLTIGGKTNSYTSPAEILLPGKKLPLKADWFSGVIRLPKGKELQYVHMGFGSIYERDHFIKIEEGKVVAEKIVDNLDNPKLYTAQADLQWQEIGKMTEGGGLVTDDPFAPQAEQKDQGDWHDARMVRATNFLQIVQSGTNFTTRGILFIQQDELFGDAYHLTVPPTPLTQWVDLPLERVPDDASELNGAHVEIKASFTKTKTGHCLNVQSVRLLKGGETIHRNDYRLPNKLFQDTANEPPEGDPFAAPEE